MKNLPPKRARWMRVRISLMAALLTAGAGAVLHRAWDLQVANAGVLRKMAEEQYLRDIRLPPKRGSIFDRRGAELAVSVDADSVWANPRALRRANWSPSAVAAQLGTVLDIDEATIARRLSSNRYFVWIKRRVTPRKAVAVRAMKIPGISILQEPRRFYPNRELAAHLLGFANVDGVGIEGLELHFEEHLRGSADTVPAIRDRRGAVVFSQQLLDDRAAHGDDIYLTIDKTIQHTAEKELELAVRTFEARAGSVVVVDPRTGELLALANFPTFNPNHPGAYHASDRRNRAVTDRFEPGSTTKVFTVAGALARGAIRPDQSVNCEDGVLDVGEHTIHDVRKWESLTPAQVLAYSSNIGAAKIGLALGRAGLFRTLRAFGFGQPTGIPLPGETRGILRHFRRWYEMDAATIAFGQGMSATTLQLAYAMGAIANRGRLMRPTLVKRMVDARGETTSEALPRVRRQVVPKWVAELVGGMLTGATGEGGTAEEAAIDGYLVAGKTGTAQKADYINGGYAKGKWLASFVGFVPVREPRLVIAVVIDEPVVAHRGGTVASPTFRRLAQTALRHLGVVGSSPGTALAAHARARRRAAREQKAAELAAARERGARRRSDKAEPKRPRPSKGESRVPDLTGATARAVVVQASEVRLRVKLQGTGLVVSQQPLPDEIAPHGSELRVVLATPLVEKELQSLASLDGNTREAGQKAPQGARQ